MTHWAFDLIGKPWRGGAQGPDAYDCWGLVREALRRGWGIEMPLVAVQSEEDQAAALRVATRGWRRHAQPAEHGDVLMMLNGRKGRHVGVMVASRLLHCGVGGVVHERLADVLARASCPEVWRRA